MIFLGIFYKSYTNAWGLLFCLANVAPKQYPVHALTVSGRAPQALGMWVLLQQGQAAIPEQSVDWQLKGLVQHQCQAPSSADGTSHADGNSTRRGKRRSPG